MHEVQAAIGPVYLLKPPYGSDLLKELQKFVLEKNITLAWLSGIGAVSQAVIRYYDQVKQQYVDNRLEQQLEVAGMWGNVSLLKGEPVVHVHLVLADRQGHCFGGHLADGTLVFNMEVLLTTLSGPAVMRKLDAQTGLSIWG